MHRKFFSLALAASAAFALLTNSPVRANSVGTGLQGEYFSDKALSVPVLTRTDSAVNFNWGSGTPDPSITSGTFSVRWSGRIQPLYSESYVFYTTTQDGVRLWVNGSAIINWWGNGYASKQSNGYKLQAGQLYDIVLEYYSCTGTAQAKLEWQSASQSRQVVPQSQLYAPLVVITSPTDNTLTTTMAPLTITMQLTDLDGTVASVAFCDGTNVLGSGTNGSNGWSYLWAAPTSGTHALTAVATRADLTSGTSPKVMVNVLQAPIHVNFQPPTTTVPPGYVQDYGMPYGPQNGYTYGWDSNLNVYPQSWAVRNSSYSPDARYDTWVAMACFSQGDPKRANWQIQVPNGIYSVHVVAGDAASTNLPEEVYVEGQLAIHGYQSASARWLEAVVGVQVNNGLLTLSTQYTSGSNPISTNLCYVDLTPSTMPPTVAFSGLASDTQVVAGAPLTLNVTASDLQGSVTSVSFYDGTTLLGTGVSGSNGWSYVYGAVPGGVHSLQAVATDSYGNTQTTTVSVRSVPDGHPSPQVSITAPVANHVFNTTLSTNVMISATASATGASVAKVEYFRSDAFAGEVKLGEVTVPPYNFTWSGAQSGTYTIRVRAWDSLSAVADATVNIVVNDVPAVSIWMPPNGWTYSVLPATVHVQVGASDADGTVTKDHLYLDGAIVATGTAGSTNLSYTLSPPQGAHILQADATDNLNATTKTSTTITVEDRTAQFDSSSFLGGTGSNYVKGAIVQADGTIVLAGVFSNATPGGVTPQLLNGATANTPGGIVRLSYDGKTVLSVTRLCTDVGDLSADGAGNLYVAARTQGVIKLDPTASTVLWTRPNDGNTGAGTGNADRLDAAPDGTVAVLRDAEEYVSTGGSKVVFVYDANGNYVGTVYGKYNRVYDVAIHGPSQTVYVAGFNQATGPSGLPVQISYIKAAAYDGTQKWMDYDWTGTQVDDPSAGGSGTTNNMADTRALRISIGRDGYLYGLFLVAGGNSIFRYDPKNILNPVTIVGGDNYENFSNSSTEWKTFFARYDPVTGNYLLGQDLCSRLSDGSANTICGETGEITADEEGRVYMALSSYTGPPLTFNPVADTEYFGGPVFVAWSQDFTKRLFVGRFSSSGYPYTIAARDPDGNGRPTVVMAGYTNAPTYWTKNSVQPNSGGGAQDGFFAAKGNMVLGGTNMIVDDLSPGVTLSGSWTRSTSSSEYGTDYLLDNNSGKGTKSATFSATIPATGNYEVYAWWVFNGNNCAAVPFQIAYSGGTASLTVNEQLYGGNWVLLGQYAYKQSDVASVTISNNGTSGNVIADAIQFSQLTGVTPPNAPSGLSSVPLSGSSLQLAWTDNSANELTFEIQHASDAGFSANLSTFQAGTSVVAWTDSALSTGTTCYYRVRAVNADGASAYCSSVMGRTLTGLELWRQAAFGNPAPTGSGDNMADSDHDSVPNLLEFGFGMNPLKADYRVLGPGGSSGMPSVSRDLAGRLTITYVRRKASTGSGVLYSVEFSDDLNGWAVNAAATEQVEDLGGDWERVTVTDSFTSVAKPKRFARVKLAAQY